MRYRNNENRKRCLELVKRWNIKSIMALLLTFGLSFSTATAQESINATGGNATGSGGSASWSIGQATYHTYTGTNGSVAEGVQQPYEISVVTGLEEAENINLSVSAYPNPVTDYLILEVKDFELSTLCFQLYDLNGKILQDKKITGNQTNIAMGNLVPATYFVKVIRENKEVKIFKIIKN